MYFKVLPRLCMFRKHTFSVQLPGCMRDAEVSFPNAVSALDI